MAAISTFKANVQTLSFFLCLLSLFISLYLFFIFFLSTSFFCLFSYLNMFLPCFLLKSYPFTFLSFFLSFFLYFFNLYPQMAFIQYLICYYPGYINQAFLDSMGVVCFDQRTHASKTLENDEKSTFSIMYMRGSCKGHEEKQRKKFVGFYTYSHHHV